MSTDVPTSQPRATFADAAVPMSRLVQVELRKMVNTRAAMWLVIVTGLFMLPYAIGLIWLSTRGGELNFSEFVLLMTNPMFGPLAILLPILGIMLVTQEWGQRTAMVTFTLEPRRGRVVAAKLITGLIMAIGSVVAALLVAIVSILVALALGGSAGWHLDMRILLGFTLMQIIGLATGFAFGMLLMNTPLALTGFFTYFYIVPAVFAGMALGLQWFARIYPWIDLKLGQLALIADDVTAQDIQHLIVAIVIWVVIPLALGIWRVLRAEVK